MVEKKTHRTLLGTCTKLADDVALHEPVPGGEELRFVLVLLPGEPDIRHPAVTKRWNNFYSAPQHRQQFSRSDVAALHAPSVKHLRLVEQFARDNNFRVVGTSAARHDVTLVGAVSEINKAFGIELYHYAQQQGHFHGHEKELQVPVEIADIVIGVLGLDGAPMRSLNRMSTEASQATPVPVSWLIEHYKFPPSIKVGGGRMAIIALDGGYHEKDMDAFFADEGVERPKIRQLSVEGAINNPLDAERLSEVVNAFNDLDNDMSTLAREFQADLAATRVTAETTMDVQIASMAAGGADIDVYFAPNSALGLYQALHAIVGLAEATDTDGEAYVRKPPSAISLSWGWGECEMSGSSAQMLETVLVKVQSMGVCICSASGDIGSLGTPQRDHRVATVLFPASSSSVLACGGTQFTDPSRQSEIVWNAANRGSPEASGGGVSGAFPMPHWQHNRNIPSHGDLNGPAWIAPGVPEQQNGAFVGRGVPDVAAYANQVPGYQIQLGGQVCGVGGTSAATPLWAGLVTRLVGHVDRPLPYFNELIYDPRFASGFVPVTEGGNAISDAGVASFSAKKGWNACCGLGLPIGRRLLTLVNFALGR